MKASTFLRICLLVGIGGVIIAFLAAIGMAAILAVQGLSEHASQPPTRSEFGTEAPDCWRYYQKDHVAWCDCMGVPYK